MNPLVLELPQNLQQQLGLLATQNGLSIQQYILEQLTQLVAYRIHAIPMSEVAQQEKVFHALRQRLGYTATVAEAQEILKQSREPVDPEPGLTVELRQRFEQKMGL